MTGGSPLGEFEQVILLGVLHAGDQAYGVPVWREVVVRTEAAAAACSRCRRRSSDKPKFTDIELAPIEGS